MHREDKIFVAGHRGLAGSAILRRLHAAGYTNTITRNRTELDLTDQASVRSFMALEKPDRVVVAAGRVGGILANSTFPADFIRENLLIQTNVIQHAYEQGVRELLFLGSSCIYPRDCPQPIREEYFMTGPLEKTNIAYATAKIAGVEMCHAYNKQHGTRYLCVMPTNLYGPEDNFDATTSHVLPAMIGKFHAAKVSGEPVTLWGSGRPRREFLHVDDLADACVHLMCLKEEPLANLFEADSFALVNIGFGEDLTIRELAELIADVTEFRGKVSWDESKPDGTPRKLLDSSRLQGLGWKPRIPLLEGVRSLYQRYFQQNQPEQNRAVRA
jgi:GDP-L-fucose synthase